MSGARTWREILKETDPETFAQLEETEKRVKEFNIPKVNPMVGPIPGVTGQTVPKQKEKNNG